MPATFEVLNNEQYVLVVYNGSFSQKDSHKAADIVVEEAERHNCTRAMLDIRKMEGSLSLMDRFDSVDYGRKLIGKIKRFALLARPDTIASNKFIETIAVNRGINLHVFSDFTEAENWLKE